MKAKTIKDFGGGAGEILTGDIAATAIREGWAEEIKGGKSAKQEKAAD